MRHGRQMYRTGLLFSTTNLVARYNLNEHLPFKWWSSINCSGWYCTTAVRWLLAVENPLFPQTPGDQLTIIAPTAAAATRCVITRWRCYVQQPLAMYQTDDYPSEAKHAMTDESTCTRSVIKIIAFRLYRSLHTTYDWCRSGEPQGLTHSFRSSNQSVATFTTVKIGGRRLIDGIAGVDKYWHQLNLKCPASQTNTWLNLNTLIKHWVKIKLIAALAYRCVQTLNSLENMAYLS